MLRSLFSAVSGLRAHQTMMDVVGNNIANVNTVGYKAGQTVFEDTLSQMVRAAGAPQGQNGGTNPAQVGLGVRLASIVTNFSQGATQLTGRSTDMAIQGDGFFTVRKGAENVYTRGGAFSFDSNGMLVSPEGAVAQGWVAKADGSVDTNGPLTDVRLPLGTLLPPKLTDKASIGGNLPTNAADGTVISAPITMYDGKGAALPVTLTYTKTGPDAWNMEASVPDPGATPPVKKLTAAPVAVAFDNKTGQIVPPATVTDPTTGKPRPDWPSLTLDGPAGGKVVLDMGAMSQFGTDNTVAVLDQNGATMGSLQAFTLSGDGTLIGVFSNGLKQPLAQIALTNFNNPAGLQKVGDSCYRSSVNSGQPQTGAAGSGGRGTLASGSLEMSNVDLAQEFTNLIIAQRGFQANTKVITSSDEMLSDLVNLKR